MTGSPQPRRLRADAQRNRRALLAAAAAVFARQGTGASIADIAVEAGVGKGTVFRHFPTKEHLLAAIVADRLGELIAAGEALLDRADPGAALLEFLTAAGELHARDRSFLDAAAAAVHHEPEVRSAGQRLVRVAEALTARARTAGAVRADLTGTDVALLLSVPHRIAAPLQDAEPELWRRYLGLIVDGMRASPAAPLPGPAPSAAQFAGEAPTTPLVVRHPPRPPA
jgi:AcrR family transcriptional regulator